MICLFVFLTVHWEDPSLLTHTVLWLYIDVTNLNIDIFAEILVEYFNNKRHYGSEARSSCFWALEYALKIICTQRRFVACCMILWQFPFSWSACEFSLGTVASFHSPQTNMIRPSGDVCVHTCMCPVMNWMNWQPVHGVAPASYIVPASYTLECLNRL